MEQPSGDADPESLPDPAAPRAPRPLWLRALRWLLLAAIIAYVAWKLTDIGWRDLASSLPANPLFYLLHVGGFFILPLTETGIARTIWRRPFRGALPMFFKKRALNNVVIGFSGDLYQLAWMKARMDLPVRRIVAGIKDNEILSGAATMLVTVAIIAILYAAAQSALLARIITLPGSALLWIGVGLAAVAVVVLRFRRTIFWIGMDQALTVLALHIFRIVAALGVVALQWEVAVPVGPWSLWLSFLAVQVLVQQLPLIPSRDLLFLGLALELSGAAGVPEAQLSAMFVMLTILKQLSNYAALGITSLIPAADIVGPPVEARTATS